MAVLQVACGLTLMLTVFYQGCHSQEPQCGVAVNNNRIIGGQDAVPDSWPWFAALNISGFIRCGGSLINNQWVLTAAHCLGEDQGNNGNIQVFLGLYNKSNPGPDVVTRSVEEVICYPNYTVAYENDICLLKLSAPVNFSDSIRPICLSSRNSTFHTGVSSWVIGFGVIGFGASGVLTLADILQEVNLLLVGNKQCDCYLRHRDIMDNMICAGVESGGNGSCVGDGGGPLMTKISTSWVQVGVLSSDFNCGFPQRPGVYTRVSHYEDWIKEHVDGSDVGFVTFTSLGFNSDTEFICPTTSPPSTYPYESTTRDDDSIFDSGENLIHFTHFFSLCAVGLLLHVLVGGDLM